MNARQRLHLEQALGGLWRDLNGTRSLLAMLGSSVSEPALATDLRELLLQTFSGPPSAGQVTTLTTAYLSGAGAEVAIELPRTVAAMLACGTELCATREDGTPQIAVARQGGDWSATLSLVAEPEGIPLTVWGYGAVPPSFSCLRGAARRVGVGVSWDAAAGVLVLTGRSGS
jgi:hypothetical protein